MEKLKWLSVFTLLCALCVNVSPLYSRVRGVVITPDSLLAQRDVTLAELLRGRVAGLQVISADGAPGGAFEMNIRGGASVRNGAMPQIYLDGVLLNPSMLDVLNPWAKADKDDYQALQSLLNGISSNDIAEIEVVSDIAASAYYGSRGANGVVIIKTKNGQRGRKFVEWNSNYGVSSTPLNSELVREGFAYNQNINIQGNHNRTDYFISGTASRHDGVMRRAGSENLGLFVKLEQYISDRSRFGVQMLFSNTRVSMIQAASMPGGTSMMTQLLNPQEGAAETAVDWSVDYDDNSTQWRMMPQLYYSCRVVGGLNFKVSGGVDYVNKVRFRWMGTRIKRGWEDNSRASRSEMWALSYTVMPELNYVFFWNKQHELNLHLNASYVGQENIFLGNYGANFTVPDLRAKGIRFAAKALNPDYLKTATSTVMGTFTADYNYIDRIQANVGYSASHMPRFDQQEVDHYPYAKVTGHVVEPIAKGLLNDLSVNLTWGLSGNNIIGNYGDIPRLLNEANFSYGLPYNALLYYYPQLKSTNNEMSVGVDVKLLDSRLSVGVDYYRGRIQERFSVRSFQPDTIKRVYDPAIQDWIETVEPVEDNHHVNTLRMQRQGVELAVSAVVLSSKKSELTLSANAAWNEMIFNGQSPCLFYGYENEDATERVVIGDGNVPFNYGAQIAYRYGPLSAQVAFDGVAGNHLLNLNGYTTGKVLRNRVEDGSFFRCSNLSVGYMIPLPKNKWIQAIGVSATATNIFTLTHYSGLSPDVNSYPGVWNQRGVDYGSYPASISYLLGFSAKF